MTLQYFTKTELVKIDDEAWLELLLADMTAVYEMFYINQSRYTTPWSEII